MTRGNVSIAALTLILLILTAVAVSHCDRRSSGDYEVIVVRADSLSADPAVEKSAPTPKQTGGRKGKSVNKKKKGAKRPEKHTERNYRDERVN